MGSSNLRIGVVVVNYNAGKYLESCVNSLLESRAPLDIVVVNNDSSDDNLRNLDGLIHSRHKIRVIRNEENIGFSRAVNQGVFSVSSKYIALINPDCTIFPMTLLKLQQALVADNSVGIAGALVFNPSGSEQRGRRRREPTFKRSMVTVLGLSCYFKGVNMNNEPMPTRSLAVDAVSGTAMMIRREYFDELRGMDERYFLHCEDLDLCRRFRDYGYMLEKLFKKWGIKPRFVHLPLNLIRTCMHIFGKIPGLRFLDAQMADRMQQDLVYSSAEAQKDFAYVARPFEP